MIVRDRKFCGVKVGSVSWKLMFYVLFSADQDDFYFPTKKFRRVGYDEDDGGFWFGSYLSFWHKSLSFLCLSEYSDTDMDDYIGARGNSKRKTLNQKRQTIGTNFNHMSNGYPASTSNTNHRTSNALPDDDVASFPCDLLFSTRHNLTFLSPTRFSSATDHHAQTRSLWHD